MLYYLHPDVSFFKGNGFTALGPYLDMPDNSSAGNVSRHISTYRFPENRTTILILFLQVWNPPDTESTSGISYDNCEAP
jgi:hypothetical protein